MASYDDPETVLRDFERDVLDKFHESIPFYHHERPAAIYSALAAYDSHIMTELLSAPMLLSGQPQVGHAQILKGLDEGFGQAIRWLVYPDNVESPLPQANAKLIQEAAGFARHASQYVDVADLHRMYGRDQVSIEADRDGRRVRFVYPEGTPPGQAMQSLEDGFASQQRWGQGLMNSSSADSDRQHFQSLLAAVEHSNQDGRILLKNPQQCVADDLYVFLKQLMPTERHYLDDLSDLVGFTFSDYNSFFNALRAWSFVASMKYIECATSGMNQELCMPTQVVDRDHFLSNIATMASLSPETSERILARLTYDDRTKSPEIFQQPLLVNDNTVSWSARCIINSRHVRNMLKLMARTTSLSDHAATLVGTREEAMLRDLGGRFSRKGKSDYKLQTIVAAGGEEGDIDLLVANQKFPEELLLVELKAVLDADEINEMDTATKYLQQGQAQLEKVERILQAMTLTDKEALFKFVPWRQVIQIYKVVISPRTLPHHGFDHSTIPAISIDNVIERMRANHLASPQKFWQRALDKPWLQPPGQCERSYCPILIGDVTYEMPGFRERDAGGTAGS